MTSKLKYLKEHHSDTFHLNNIANDHLENQLKDENHNSISLKFKDIKTVSRMIQKLKKICKSSGKNCELEISKKQQLDVNRQKEIGGYSNFNSNSKVEKPLILPIPQMKQKEMIENDEIDKSYSVSEELKEEIMNAENSK